jgi:glycosyltransferase involved in cell wall biosynthesis
VSDGEDGFLLPPAAEPIADRLIDLLLNPATARRLGANGQAKVAARYSWRRLAALTEAVYTQALGGPA